MLKKIIRAVLTLLGVSGGYALGVMMLGFEWLRTAFNYNPEDVAFTIIFSTVVALIIGFILYILSPYLIRRFMGVAKHTEKELEKIPANTMLFGSVGLILGLMIAYLINGAINNIQIPFVSGALSILAYIFLGYLGARLATKNMADLSRLPDMFRRSGSKGQGSKEQGGAKPKILDTSVIIDGRIADICKTGFVEGPIIIPEFVLEELRHIADSSDSLKRNRGRRGLDILKVIQKEINVEVKIVSTNFEDVSEVDIKLLKLAKVMNGFVVTNDYNLNKVAELQDVRVLNINELANAIKPVVLPGEEMVVHVIKEGKESNQGIAYLDDGTMIVVEGGKRHMNETLEVLVTSVLQTAAGRMIFAKPL
ncbi:PIN/TRAM domain-containing protein [Acidaminobacter hydrogenoformans]|uniref:Uncharacterized conserved protein YacL, contains PIN and TRAM domains n=1 Tax=Acidaminobacter hydrogenoformans DSM 2784 TaxID=1120920 RepID=A0A1G5S6M7_9FIRM|nr:PIN/TRAM domain-containing protein [Acidaminobacter hydrogenoformans]SCZ81976.1 Uncharacterized conserved protein YacL, contains PIN and TRAM domains [Acidaminobacter hydrogenoformans DSM 2784]